MTAVCCLSAVPTFVSPCPLNNSRPACILPVPYHPSFPPTPPNTHTIWCLNTHTHTHSLPPEAPAEGPEACAGRG